MSGLQGKAQVPILRQPPLFPNSVSLLDQAELLALKLRSRDHRYLDQNPLSESLRLLPGRLLEHLQLKHLRVMEVRHLESLDRASEVPRTLGIRARKLDILLRTV